VTAPVAAAPVVERPSAAPDVESPSQPRVRIHLRTVGALGTLVVLAAALRVESIGRWYWIDEALSVGLASHDLLDIPSLLLRDGSPPLWYGLLHGWMHVFGTSALATHALSAVFAIAAVPIAWAAGRRVFGERTAWLVAVLAALSPFVTYFATETRMYSLVVLLGTAVAATFVAAFVDGRRRALPWFAASLVALLYTHNWGLYTACACVLALGPVLAASNHRRAVLRRAAITFGAVGLLYLPWLPVLASQVQNTGAPWSYTPSYRDVVRELAALFRDERILAVITLAAGAGLVPLRRRWRSREAVAVAALGILASVPVVIGWVLAHVEPSWATRYLAVVVGPLLLVVGHGLARARGVGIAAVALLALLVLQPVTRLGGLDRPEDAKSNARAVAELAAPRMAEGDLVLVAQPEAMPLLAGYLGDDLRYADPTGLVDDPHVMDWRGAGDRLAAVTASDIAARLDLVPTGDRVLLVTSGNAPATTDTAWIEMFRSAGRRAERLLRGDDGFQLVARVRGPAHPYASFDASLWERVSGPADDTISHGGGGSEQD